MLIKMELAKKANERMSLFFFWNEGIEIVFFITDASTKKPRFDSYVCK